MRTRRVTTEQIDYAVARYAEGWTTRRIADAIGVSDPTVARHLREQGVSLRRAGPRRGPLPISDGEIVERYLAGALVREIAADCKCRTDRVSAVLEARQVTIRPGGKRRLPDGDVQDIVARYAAGESLTSIADRHALSTVTVREIARGHDSTRMRPMGKPKFWTSDRIGTAVEHLRAGQSMTELAASMGVRPQSVRVALRHAGFGAPMGSPKRGPDHPSWKGGRRLDQQSGYWMVRPSDEDHSRGLVPSSARYMFEHRLVVARSLGRALSAEETVHHIDGNPKNNDLSNLQLRQGNHGRGAVATCRGCGSHDIDFAPLP